MLSIEKIKRIYSLLNISGLKEKKENLIDAFTFKRTTSVRQMNKEEVNDLILYLKGQCQTRRKPMRAKIVHLLCELGYTKGVNPDYDRINKFVENIGKKNPKKKELLALTYAELQRITSQVEVMYHRETLKKA